MIQLIKKYVDKFQQYGAIVDAAGNGDYLLLSAAVTAGETSIFVRSGTYNETATITLTNNNTIIVGEKRDTTIIDFGANAATLAVSGTLRTPTPGTITGTNGSTTVTGVGTNFLAGGVSAGDYIVIEETYHEISSVTDALNLELVVAYQGATISGQAYLIIDMFYRRI